MALTLTINGVTQDDKAYRYGGLSPQWRIGGRSTLDLPIRDPAQAYRPTVGHEVILYDGAAKIWGGSIDEYTEGNVGFSQFRENGVRCVSYERLLDKRVWGPVTYGRNFFTTDFNSDAFVAPGHFFTNGTPVQVKSAGALPGGLFTGTTYYVINVAGDALQLSLTSGGAAVDLLTNGSGLHSMHWTAGGIIRAIMAFMSVAEGVTLGTILPGVLIEIAAYDRAGLWQIFDELATLSGYIVYVDADKQLQFVSRTQTPAPWDATDGSKILQGDGFSVRTTREQLANAVYLKIAKESRAPTFQQREGDGTKQQFRFGTAIRELVNLGAPISSSPTVGIYEADTGKDFYYTPNDYWIIQDPSATPLTVGQFVTISYYAPGFDTEFAEDTAAQAARAAIEGGSGIYERVEERSDITTREGGQALADALLNLYKTVPNEVKYTTREPGLRPGMLQTITQADYDVNDSYLLQSVSAKLDDDGKFRFETSWISTTRLKDFLSTFQSFLGGGSGGGSTTVGSGGVGGTAGGATILPVALTAGAGTDTISQAVVTGGLLVLHITQNSTGDRQIDWSADFLTGTPVDIPMIADATVTMMFGAVAGKWVLISGPTKPVFEA